ncbi:MAG TPA: TolC family protein, partial [Gemmatimonadales bacterium]|nr:TolC family protein [Gemmatimonadales bacterium]
FTNFSRSQELSRAKAFEADLAESVRAQALFVVTGVSEAFLDLRTAHRAVQIQAQNRRASEESLQLATERYRVGSGTFFELNDAQLADLTAQFDYVNSIYDYHKALALLEAAVGRSLR